MSEDVRAGVANQPATRREWIGLAVLALPTLLLSVDVSVLFLALPKLSAALGADAIEQLWILDIYSFLLAGLLITMGNVGDRIGRRKLLLIGGAGFAAASVLAAFSTTPEMLIASRALLGIAGATLAPSTMALIRNMFQDPRQMGIAIGVWFTCFMGGMLVGPIIGGVLLEHFWWGSAFLLGVPVMLLLLVLGPRFLPEYKAAEPGRIDPLSVALSLVAVLLVIWGLKELARSGWNATPVGDDRDRHHDRGGVRPTSGSPPRPAPGSLAVPALACSAPHSSCCWSAAWSCRGSPSSSRSTCNRYSASRHSSRACGSSRRTSR